jgi:hypothetical protein
VFDQHPGTTVERLDVLVRHTGITDEKHQLGVAPQAARPPVFPRCHPLMVTSRASRRPAAAQVLDDFRQLSSTDG